MVHTETNKLEKLDGKLKSIQTLSDQVQLNRHIKKNWPHNTLIGDQNQVTSALK